MIQTYIKIFLIHLTFTWRIVNLIVWWRKTECVKTFGTDVKKFFSRSKESSEFPFCILLFCIVTFQNFVKTDLILKDWFISSYYKYQQGQEIFRKSLSCRFSYHNALWFKDASLFFSAILKHFSPKHFSWFHRIITKFFIQKDTHMFQLVCFSWNVIFNVFNCNFCFSDLIFYIRRLIF